MHTSDNIGPPKESLGERCPVVRPHLEFDDLAARMQANPVHALHSLHRVVVGAPDRQGTIRVVLDLRVHRHERCGPVMLRPVKLHPTRNPRTGQADQRRLDDILPVKNVIPFRFVPRGMDAASDLREDHHLKKFIL